MNQRLSRLGWSVVCSLAAVASASAHPGHALQDASVMHLLTSADHLALLALAGVALWFGARHVAARWPRLALQGLGVIALLAAAIVWGLRG